MRKNERIRRDAEITMKKIREITKHIRNVEDNCLILGEKLIERGEILLGRQIIANGFIHDASKFAGIEFEFLSPGHPEQLENAKLKLKLAIHHHQKTNLHHPEAWSGGIKGMPDVYLAEFCCDVKARSEEFGTDLRGWINDTATQKYGFTEGDGVYQKIMVYIDLLCPKPFEDLSK